MSDQNQTNKNQIEWDKEEDEIFIGSLSSIEICGYGLLIISMLSLLLTYKFGIPLKVFSWGGLQLLLL